MVNTVSGKISKLPSLGIGFLGAVGSIILVAGAKFGFTVVGVALDAVGGIAIGLSIFAAHYTGKNKIALDIQDVIDKVNAIVPPAEEKAVAGAVITGVEDAVKKA